MVTMARCTRTHRKYFQKNLWQETETTSQQVGWNPPSASILRRKTQVIWTVYYSHRPWGSIPWFPKIGYPGFSIINAPFWGCYHLWKPHILNDEPLRRFLNMALAKGAIGRLKVPQPEASAKAWCSTLPGSWFIWLVVCYEVTKYNM